MYGRPTVGFRGGATTPSQQARKDVADRLLADHREAAVRKVLAHQARHAEVRDRAKGDGL